MKSESSVGRTMKVFISYGHDEHASLAARIRDDLRKRGHKVWFDEERLKPGHDWELFIEQGLEDLAVDRANSAVILLLTPHSVRRPEGYCLNEVTRALARGLRIIPLMVVYAETPLSICRVQWLDMRQCIPIGAKEKLYAPKFDRLLEALEEGRLDFEGTQQRLLQTLKPQEFEADRHLHPLKFIGREWVFEAVSRWLADEPDRRVFWIRGGPGTGKTALSVMLSSHYLEVSALHLCQHGHAQKGNPGNVVSSIAYQLSTQLPDYEARLVTMDVESLVRDDARTMFENLIVQPLAGIRPPERPVIVMIDALDEAGGLEHNELAEFIATEFRKTPQWLRLIVTSRPESEVETPLQGIRPFELDTAAEANREDIRKYLRRELATDLKGRTDADSILEQILGRSEGVFQYVELFCNDIRDGHLSLDRPEQFPQGLGGIYYQYFRRRFPDIAKYRNEVRPALRTILAARDPLPVAILKDIFGWEEEELWDFTRALGSLFPVRPEAGTGADTVIPFHRSMADWLTEHTCSGIYYISKKEGHRMLADYFERQPLSPRQASELPWQLRQIEARDRLKACLLDIDRFLLIRERDEEELRGYWVWLKEERQMGKPYLQSFEDWVGQPGRDDRRLGYAAACLGYFLRNAALHAEAEPLYKRALAIDEKSYGPEHPEVAIALNNLAMLYKATNRLAEAEPLMKRALAIGEKSHGPEHPNVAIRLSNLAMLYKATNRLAEAEPLMKRALAIAEKSHGAEHPNVAAALNNLAQLYKDTNRLAEAEPLMKRALGIDEKSYGPEHPAVALKLNNLALLYQDTNRLAEAEPLMKRVVTIFEKSYGAEHPNVAIALNNLATLFKATNRLAEAEPLMKRALAIDEKSYGPEHPEVATDLSNLAILYKATNRLAEAEPLYKRALAIAEKSFGPEHPDVAIKLNNLATLYYATNRLAEAEPLMKRSVEILLRFNAATGHEHPHQRSFVDNYKTLLSEMGRSGDEIRKTITELGRRYGMDLGSPGSPSAGGLSPKLHAVVEQMVRDPSKASELVAKLGKEDPALLQELIKWVQSQQK